MRSLWRTAAVVACIALAPPAARAQPEREARGHFEVGRGLYDLGRYQDAIVEFQTGYALAPKPQFLINLGQCYRRLKQLELARGYFSQFLEVAPPNDPQRTEVTGIIAALDEQLRTERGAPPRREPPPQVSAPPVRETPPPAPPPAVVAPPAPAPVAIAQPVAVASAPPRRSFLRRYWWIIPVAAAATAGIAVGIYFGTRSSGGGCGDANLCLSFK